MYGVMVVLAFACQIAYVWWFHTNVTNLVIVIRKAWKACTKENRYDAELRWYIIMGILCYWLVLPWFGLLTILGLTTSFLWIKYDVMGWLNSQGKQGKED